MPCVVAAQCYVVKDSAVTALRWHKIALCSLGMHAQALYGWQLLATKYAQRPCTPFTAACAIEDAAMHVHKLATGEASPWMMEKDEEDSDAARAELCSGRLDAVAAKVQQMHPHAFPQPQCAAGRSAFGCFIAMLAVVARKSCECVMQRPQPMSSRCSSLIVL